MTHAIAWLRNRSPGFCLLGLEEQDAITDFSLLWSFFECRLLNNDGSARRICAEVDRWVASGGVSRELFEAELAYFRDRYYANGGFTHHFDGLHLRKPDQEPMVRGVLDGSNRNLRDEAATSLIVVYRFRNNLFHGVKWSYEFAGQFDNFTHANRLLIKVLDRYGADD